MAFSVESLLKAGFTKRELRYIYNNIYSFGGTLEEIVRDLAKRFKVFICIFICTVISCSLVTYLKWSDPWYIFSCVITFLFFDLIMLFIQPPVISFKCWRFCRINKS